MARGTIKGVGECKNFLKTNYRNKVSVSHLFELQTHTQTHTHMHARKHRKEEANAEYNSRFFLGVLI